MPKPKPTVPSESDILFNRLNVLTSQHHRVLGSILPPRSHGPSLSGEFQSQEDEDDAQVLAATPDVTGLGIAKLTPNDQPRKSNSASIDALRTQLLGKRSRRDRDTLSTDNNSSLPVPSPAAAKPRHSSYPQPPLTDDDDDESRLASLQSKRSHKKRSPAPDMGSSRSPQGDMTQKNQDVLPETETDSQTKPTSGTPKLSKKRASNFLDELLGERKKSKKKRQQPIK